MTSSAALPPIRSDESGRWLLTVSSLEQALRGTDQQFNDRLEELRKAALESPRGTGRMLNAARELEALAQEPGLPPQRLFALFFTAGRLLSTAGRFREATHRFRAAQQHAEKAGDRKRQYMALNETGVTFGRMSCAPDALRCFEKLAELASAMGDSVKLTHALVNQAGAHLLGGNIEVAIATAERAVAIARETGDTQALLSAQQFLANSLASKGDLERAAELLQEVIDSAADLGALSVLATACGNLACLRIREARFSEAVALYEQARETFVRLNLPDDVARSELNMGTACLELGELAKAESHLFNARVAFEIQQNHTELAAVCCNLALLAIEQGDVETAERYITTAEQKLGERAVPEMLALLHATRAEVHSAAGNEALALAANQLAAEVARRADMPQEYVTAELACAENHLRMRDPSEALRCVEAALQSSWCIGSTQHVECVEALAQRARALLMSGRADEAREVAEDALEQAEELPMLRQATGRRVRRLTSELRLLRDTLGL